MNSVLLTGSPWGNINKVYHQYTVFFGWTLGWTYPIAPTHCGSMGVVRLDEGLKYKLC